MLNFTDFTSIKSPKDVIALQANAARSVLAYVPVEAVRTQLSNVVDLNETLASSIFDAYAAYGDAVKAKVLKA